MSGRVPTLPNALSALVTARVLLFVGDPDPPRRLALIILTLSGDHRLPDGKDRSQVRPVSVGQLLDPIADRLYIVSTLLCLVWREIIPWWVVIVLFAREAFMAVVVYHRQEARVERPPGPLLVGKAATFNLLYAFPCCCWQTAMAPWRPPNRSRGASHGGASFSTGWLNPVCRAAAAARGRTGDAHERTAVGTAARR